MDKRELEIQIAATLFNICLASGGRTIPSRAKTLDDESIEKEKEFLFYLREVLVYE